jgi:hypothetical protein
MLVALLSKPSLRFHDPHTCKPRPVPSTTCLYLVPHRDLAYQLYHWVWRLVQAHNVLSPASIAQVAHVLVRDGEIPITDSISLLKRHQPHLVISTPQALMDVLRQDTEALRLSELSVVAVDEADYLIETVPKKKHASSKWKFTALEKKIQRHPGATRQLLDLIYKRRRALKPSDDLVDEAAVAPQLILCSATLSLHLKSYLLESSGWLNQPRLETIYGASAPIPAPSDDVKTSLDQPASVTHSVLVVSDSSIKNVEFAMTDNMTSAIRQRDQTESREEKMYDEGNSNTVAYKTSEEG